jgi:hypothetical protein
LVGTCISTCVPSKAPRQSSKYRLYLKLLDICIVGKVSPNGRVQFDLYRRRRASITSWKILVYYKPIIFQNKK